ncbi:MAG: hypothetical protein AB2L11_04375 [Syntrophobacteraceae bacterium]
MREIIRKTGIYEQTFTARFKSRRVGEELSDLWRDCGVLKSMKAYGILFEKAHRASRRNDFITVALILQKLEVEKRNHPSTPQKLTGSNPSS